jgi:hypothetical protein
VPSPDRVIKRATHGGSNGGRKTRGSNAPQTDTHGISCFSPSRHTATPSPPMRPRVWLCRVLGEGASRRAAVSRARAACDTIDTSRHSLTALLGCRSVVIGHRFPPITKNATEPRVYDEVCPLNPNRHYSEERIASAKLCEPF